LTRWVVDAAPLIFLAKLGRLDILRTGANEVLTTPIVIREIDVRQDAAAAAVKAAAARWLGVRPALDSTAVTMLLGELDAGESEAIVLAHELSADRIVLDDLDARRHARRIGLHVVGTVGVPRQLLLPVSDNYSCRCQPGVISAATSR
jgi:hypothetical protein